MPKIAQGCVRVGVAPLPILVQRGRFREVVGHAHHVNPVAGFNRVLRITPAASPGAETEHVEADPTSRRAAGALQSASPLLPPYFALAHPVAIFVSRS